VKLDATCPVEGCGEARCDGHLCCRRHWYSISAGLREKVWRAYRVYQRRSTAANLARLREVQAEAVREASVRCERVS
jgi:hypothetical protein